MLYGPKDTRFLKSGRGTQVVRERSAKPLCVGSIPTRASIISITYGDRRKNWLPFGCQLAAKWFKTSIFQLRRTR
jgi:hypothetical protein